jgi:hypothetical protein
VNSFLKEKADKQLNCLIRLLGEHCDLNPINFGESLWNSVMRPSLTHACAVWMPLFGVFHLKTPTYTSNGCIYTRSTKYDISMEQFSKNNLEKNVTENKPLKRCFRRTIFAFSKSIKIKEKQFLND